MVRKIVGRRDECKKKMQVRERVNTRARECDKSLNKNFKLFNKNFVIQSCVIVNIPISSILTCLVSNFVLSNSHISKYSQTCV